MSRSSWAVLAAVLIMAISFASPAAAQERFVDNGDGTITDTKLGLMWAATDNQGDINWHEAEKWVRFTFPMTLGKIHENWRMPTLAELESLYVRDVSYKGYETACGQRVKITPQIRLTCGWVWASEKKSITARVYNFSRGYHYTDRMVHKRAYRVLPVRTIR